MSDSRVRDYVQNKLQADVEDNREYYDQWLRQVEGQHPWSNDEDFENFIQILPFLVGFHLSNLEVDEKLLGRIPYRKIAAKSMKQRKVLGAPTLLDQTAKQIVNQVKTFLGSQSTEEI